MDRADGGWHLQDHHGDISRKTSAGRSQSPNGGDAAEQGNLKPGLSHGDAETSTWACSTCCPFPFWTGTLIVFFIEAIRRNLLKIGSENWHNRWDWYY